MRFVYKCESCLGLNVHVYAPTKRTEQDLYFKGLLNWLIWQNDQVILLFEEIGTVFKTNFLIVKDLLVFIYPKSTSLCLRKKLEKI